MQADDPRHNSTAGYVAGCRESCCRAAIAAWMKHYRTRRYLHGHQQIDGLGTRRRIRALMALGWSTAVLDAELGKARTYTTALLRRNGPVYVTTAQQYAALYERLSMTLPPDETRYQRQFASRARNLARRNGWPPPFAWDDIDDPNERPQGARRDWHRGPGHDSLDHAVVERLLLGERLTQRKLSAPRLCAGGLLMVGQSAEFITVHGWQDGRYRRPQRESREREKVRFVG